MNISTYMSYVPKRTFVLFGLILAMIAPLGSFASWSPARDTLTYNGAGTPGANHVVFNSFTNNPYYGDERTFFDVKKVANTSEGKTYNSLFTEGGFVDQVNVKDGDILMLRAYVHNNADPSLNADGSGVAKDVSVYFNLPEATDTSLRAIGHITASNASPTRVSDTVDFTGSNPFSLSYLDSATAFTNAVPGGYAVSNSIINPSGAPVGHTGPNGTIPGCFEYDAIVVAFVEVNMSDVSIVKKTRVEGSSDWVVKNTAKPGDTLEYLITAKNTGSTTLKNVVVGDNLPPHMTYVEGSTRLTNASNPSGIAITSDNITRGGIDIGNYLPGANAHVTFKVKIDKNLGCGTTTFKNVGVVRPEGMNEFFNTAITTVKVQCDETETPPKETPPKKLPNTGPAETALAFTGTGSAAYAISSFRRSRKNLLDALLRK